MSTTAILRAAAVALLALPALPTLAELPALAAADAVPTLTRTADALRVDLGDGVRLEFSLAGDLLVGLHRAEVDGLALTSDRTVWRPVLSLDGRGARPVVNHALVLRDAAVVDGAVVLTAGVAMTGDDAAWKRLYLVAPDLAHADADPGVQAARAAVDAEEARLAPAIAADPQVVKRTAEVAALPPAPADDDGSPAANQLRNRRQAATSTLSRAQAQAREAAIAADPALAAALATWTARRAEVGLVRGVPLRDFHGFPILALPAEVTTPAAWQALAESAPATVVGTLRWTVRLDRQIIAG